MRTKLWQGLQVIIALVIGVPIIILALLFFFGPYVLLLWRVLFSA